MASDSLPRSALCWMGRLFLNQQCKESMHNIASPDNSDSAIEQLIQAKGLNAPRVVPAALQAVIVSAHYFTAAEGVLGELTSDGVLPTPFEKANIPEALKLLTFCVLVLRNGFTVVGKSACASPENFDREVGERVARDNAEREIWPLLGYALKEQLSKEQAR